MTDIMLEQIPTGSYDTVSWNQDIVGVMSTAYAKVNNACPVAASAQPDIKNNIIIIRNMITNFKYWLMNKQHMQTQTKNKYLLLIQRLTNFTF